LSAFVQFGIIVFILSVILAVLAYILGSQNPDFEKLSAYECGFQRFSPINLPFNIQFYRVAILFLIFDIEIAFLFPWAVYFYDISFFGHITCLLFLIILVIGFIFEWRLNALTWEQ